MKDSIFNFKFYPKHEKKKEKQLSIPFPVQRPWTDAWSKIQARWRQAKKKLPIVKRWSKIIAALDEMS